MAMIGKINFKTEDGLDINLLASFIEFNRACQISMIRQRQCLDAVIFCGVRKNLG
jgi:hypothetical protein